MNINRDALVFAGGHILTMTKNMAAEAVAVEHGRILHAGSLTDCRKAAGTEFKEIDLDGRCLIPGFIDPHIHPVMFGQMSTMATLSGPNIKSINDLIGELKKHAQDISQDKPVRGFGYNHNRLAEGRHPSADELNQVASDRPVYALHTSGHHASVNRFAFSKAGIGLDTPDPPGGRIVRDDQGNPTGVLLDNAITLIMDQDVELGNHGPNFHYPEKLDDLVTMLDSALKAYTAAGITTVVDVQVTKRETEVYLSMRTAGILKNRVIMMYISSYLDDLIHLGMSDTLGDAFLSFGPLKLYEDGALTGNTARLSRPYKHDPEDFGFLYHDPEELKEIIVKAHKFGLQTATHCQGDAAIDIILDAIEAAQQAAKREDVRHRIEHCGLPREDQVARMRDLSVWPIPQPRYIYEAGDGVVRSVGEDLADKMMPLGLFKQYGLPLVLSSDSPVVHYDPILGISAAVTRTTSSGRVLGHELAISVEDALRGYTIGAAASVHREGDLGSIEGGKWADLAVLDRNPLEIPEEEIVELKVEETWIAGERVYSCR